MDEQFLHYVWKFHQFRTENLTTTQGEKIVIFSQGFHNHDAGPDFQNARIKIEDIEWVGQVEIHVKSSDWLKHRHQQDRAYDNVILHVVHELDTPIEQNGRMIPTLELAGLIDETLVDNYKTLSGNIYDIPCQEVITNVDGLKTYSMLTRVAGERMESKASQLVGPLLKRTDGDWETVAFICLARALGMKINSDCFEALALSLPGHYLLKHQHRPDQIEALVFGMAGFLDTSPIDDYQRKLAKEFAFLKHKYNLEPRLVRHEWKYARLRPANFPTVRLAQLSAIMTNTGNLMSFLIHAERFDEVRLLLTSEVSEYWQYHFDFGKASKKKLQLGEIATSGTIINAVVPLLVGYGDLNGAPGLKEKALSWLENLPAENNKITRRWDNLNIIASSAFESQGQIQLFNAYCLTRKCLQCEIGSTIVSRPC